MVTSAVLAPAPHFRTGRDPISVIPALPHPIPFALTQTLHYSAPEELNCSEQSPGEHQVFPTSTPFCLCCILVWKNLLLQLRNPKSDQQRPWSSWVSAHRLPLLPLCSAAASGRRQLPPAICNYFLPAQEGIYGCGISLWILTPFISTTYKMESEWGCSELVTQPV